MIFRGAIYLVNRGANSLSFSIWDWLYLIVVGGFSAYALFYGVKTIIKIHNAAKKGS